jgi:hypothetical protein
MDDAVAVYVVGVAPVPESAACATLTQRIVPAIGAALVVVVCIGPRLADGSGNSLVYQKARPGAGGRNNLLQECERESSI